MKPYLHAEIESAAQGHWRDADVYRAFESADLAALAQLKETAEVK